MIYRSSPMTGPADADSARLHGDILRDFYRDLPPGDWRNRRLPRGCRAVPAVLRHADRRPAAR